MTILLLAGLVVALWYTGGKAFSPGRLSALNKSGAIVGGFSSHAEFESECQRCHLPLETSQNVLCVACHDGIAMQIASGEGSHARIPTVNRCAACHRDHLGNDFDPTRSAYFHFDHAATNFSLVKHQLGYDTTPIDCLACHSEEAGFPIALDGCVNCHASEDFDFVQQHSADFGFDCLMCHDGIDMMSGFDHQASLFPLNGRHVEIPCSACHTQVRSASEQAINREEVLQVFRQSPSKCASCHQEPEMHAGIFTQSCNVCHNAQAWVPATIEGEPFDHHLQTDFSLVHHQVDYSGQSITCRTCHLVNIFAFETEQCSICHEQDKANPGFIQEHRDQYGPACLECHDGIDRMRGFRHEERYPLQGRHAETACLDCHVAGSYIDTPSECVNCHAEPEIHAGFFGLKCQYCHDAGSWTPARLQIHNFPVTHGDQDGSDCQICHLESYTEYTCFTCHEHQPGPILETHQQEDITAEELPACADCHPGGQLEE